MFAGKIFYAAVGNQIDGPPVVVFDPSQATGTSSSKGGDDEKAAPTAE
jgi:hypothetical protein